MIGLSGTLRLKSLLTVIFWPPAGTLTCWNVGMETPEGCCESCCEDRCATCMRPDNISGSAKPIIIREIDPSCHAPKGTTHGTTLACIKLRRNIVEQAVRRDMPVHRRRHAPDVEGLRGRAA